VAHPPTTPSTAPANTPPPQGNRVQSFSTPATQTVAAATAELDRPEAGAPISSSPARTRPFRDPWACTEFWFVTHRAPARRRDVLIPGATAHVTLRSELQRRNFPCCLSENRSGAKTSRSNTAVTHRGFSVKPLFGPANPAGAAIRPSPRWSGQQPCYPAGGELHTPLYYMINGVAFNKASAAPNPSLFAAKPGTSVGPGRRESTGALS